MKKLIVGITMGDPAGVGPEICLKAVKNQKITDQVIPLLIGDKLIFEKMKKTLKIQKEFQYISDAELINLEFDNQKQLVLLSDYQLNKDVNFGEGTKEGALSAKSAIDKAIELADRQLIDVIVTSPISKDNFSDANIKFNNHTSIFQNHYFDYELISMFHCIDLKVFHFTRHISLQEAIHSISIKNILTSIRKMNKVMTFIGDGSEKLALAALNPHASDNGLFGVEEEKYLMPAVTLAKKEGIMIEGPIPADTVFYKQRMGVYDAVLSLYHDQGHIACKTLSFDKSVSLTFGLPFIRATVDHGTAYDIAGKNIASSKNLEEAIFVSANYQNKINKNNERNKKNEQMGINYR